MSVNGTIKSLLGMKVKRLNNATSRSIAKRTNYANFKQDDLVYLLNPKSLIKGSFQGIEDQFVLLKIDNEKKNITLSKLIRS